MLPALWVALSLCPHGDLAPDDLRIERARQMFRIFDPGVRIPGPSRRGTLHRLDFDSELFTTNAERYPFVAPEHGPDRPRLGAPAGGLAQVVERQAQSTMQRWITAQQAAQSVVTAPSAADVVACGAIYFRVLAGASLISVLGLAAPLWAGFWSDRGDHPDPRPRCIDELAGGAIRRALRPTGATGAEIELCEQLIRLELDRDDVLRAAGDAAASIA
jgi:hypothetical protein